MSELPRGWAKASLADIAATQLGRMLSASRETGAHARPYLRNRDVQWGKINVVDLPTMDFEPAVADRYRLMPGDVLVCEGGEVGRAAVWRSDLDECYYQKALHRVRVSDAVSATFLRFLFEHYASSHAFEQFTSGSTIAHLPQEDLRNLPINLPPRAEQDRIVDAIEEELSRLDAGVAAIDRVARNTERMRAAVLQSAVSGGLVPSTRKTESGPALVSAIGDERKAIWSIHTSKPYKTPPNPDPLAFEFPCHWGVASLEALTDPVRVICYGILKPRTKTGGAVPYVEVKDLRASRLSLGALHRTSSELDQEFARSRLAAGDVVLAIRGSYDRALVVSSEVAGANLSRDVARIAPLDGVEPAFLAAYLRSPPALRYLSDQARGVAVKGVNIGDLRKMPVPVPPTNEQREIVEELARAQSILDERAQNLEIEEKRTKALRRSILAAAFEGRLVEQDPAEEPISALLERIAIERATGRKQNSPPKHGRGEVAA